MENLVRRPDPAFWSGKSVLLTGHTGFKGAWAARMLALLGARVTGFGLDPATPTFEALGVARGLVRDLRGDLRDAGAVAQAVEGAEITLHLAAQAIVSEGWRDPAATWEANLNGTLTLLQALRGRTGAAVIVTSDKVYRNDGSHAFTEADALGGEDPYSGTKAACEILVSSHRASYSDLPLLATARAGNVIGGGDFGRDRLIPDLVRAKMAGQALTLRNPTATRPFQHVLDVVSGYLILAEDLALGLAPRAVNFGPSEQAITVLELISEWEAAAGPVDWHVLPSDIPEKPRLALDSRLAEIALGWRPSMTTRQAVARTAIWYDLWAKGDDMPLLSDADISNFLEG